MLKLMGNRWNFFCDNHKLSNLINTACFLQHVVRKEVAIQIGVLKFWKIPWETHVVDFTFAKAASLQPVILLRVNSTTRNMYY